MFSILAHDIKSPLNLFQGLLNMSEEKTLSEKEFLEYQQILKSRLKTLTCTVNELLTWSRLQLEGFTTEPVAVNIYKVAKETINLYKALIEKKKIQLDLICNENIEVMIDENHFKMAFRNLLHNALKYSNSDGTVKIHAQKLGDRCELLIADSGVGMDGATLIAVRNKEIQKSAAGTNHEIGTGIGLSLALGLLEKNECKIELMSEVNQGTTFKISLKTTTDKQRKYPPKAILST
ncbi:MAG: HAMP domain-containing sensor histidine kinase [Bacteroidota bacterium]